MKSGRSADSVCLLQPLLHAIVFLIQITMVSILVRKFNSYYAARPVLTTMITNAVSRSDAVISPSTSDKSQVLGGIADTVAQTLTAVRVRRERRNSLTPGNPANDDFFSIEIRELDKKVPWPENDWTSPASKRGPPPFDFERTVRFMAYPFIMTPLQHRWFAFLSKTFPLIPGHATAAAMKRVAFDQLLFAPVGTSSLLSLRGSFRTDVRCRSGVFFHFYDCSRGRRQARCPSQISRRLHTCAQGEFPRLAAGAGAQFSNHTDTIPDCECYIPMLRKD